MSAFDWPQWVCVSSHLLPSHRAEIYVFHAGSTHRRLPPDLAVLAALALVCWHVRPGTLRSSPKLRRKLAATDFRGAKVGVAKTRGCLPQRAETLHCRSMTTTHHTLHYRAMTTTHHTLHYRVMTTTHHTLHYRVMTTTHHTLHYRAMTTDTTHYTTGPWLLHTIHYTTGPWLLHTILYTTDCLARLRPRTAGARAVLSGRSRGFTLHLTECSSTLAASCWVFCYLTHTGFALLVMYCTRKCVTVILEMRRGCFITLLVLDLRCWSCTVHTDVSLLYWRWGKGVLLSVSYLCGSDLFCAAAIRQCSSLTDTWCHNDLFAV